MHHNSLILMASLAFFSLLPFAEAAQTRTLLGDAKSKPRPTDIPAIVDRPWSAEWIGPRGGAGPNSWICYRTEIDCPKPGRKVEARIACDSKYWLFWGSMLWGR